MDLYNDVSKRGGSNEINISFEKVSFSDPDLIIIFLIIYKNIYFKVCTSKNPKYCRIILSYKL